MSVEMDGNGWLSMDTTTNGAHPAFVRKMSISPLINDPRGKCFSLRSQHGSGAYEDVHYQLINIEDAIVLRDFLIEQTK